MDKQDGKINRLLPVSFNRRITLKENLNEQHLFYSVLAKSPLSNFSRLERVTCCFVMIYLIMLLNLIFYQNNALKINEYLKGFISSLIAYLFCFFLVNIFKRIKIRNSRFKKLQLEVDKLNKEFMKTVWVQNEFEIIKNFKMIKQTERKKLVDKRKNLWLPWWLIYPAYIFSWILMTFMVLIIMHKGISLGNETCKKWFFSMIISIAVSIILIYPIQV